MPQKKDTKRVKSRANGITRISDSLPCICISMCGYICSIYVVIYEYYIPCVALVEHCAYAVCVRVCSAALQEICRELQYVQGLDKSTLIAAAAAVAACCMWHVAAAKTDTSATSAQAPPQSIWPKRKCCDANQTNCLITKILLGSSANANANVNASVSASAIVSASHSFK